MFESTLKAIEQKSKDFNSIKLVDNPRAIIFEGLLGEKRNAEILDEAISLKKSFTEGVTKGGLNKKLRSNSVCYYDEVFKDRRDQSYLLNALDSVFKSIEFQEILGSAGVPFCDFGGTNYHESQVSRYGGTGQKYDWHVDRLGANTARHISLVYYFFKEPKKFKGGDLVVSNGLIVDGRKVAMGSDYSITPKNDMAIVFASTTPHCVTPCTSPTKFENGRFSVNCWIGFK